MALPVLILREGVTALFSSAVRTVSGSISAIAAASSSVKSSAILFSDNKYTTHGGIFSTDGVFKTAVMRKNRSLAALLVELLAKAFRHFSQGSPSFPTLSIVAGCEWLRI